MDCNYTTIKTCELKGSTFRSHVLDFGNFDISEYTFSAGFSNSLGQKLNDVQLEKFGNSVILPLTSIENKSGRFRSDVWMVTDGNKDLAVRFDISISDTDCGCTDDTTHDITITFQELVIPVTVTQSVVNINYLDYESLTPEQQAELVGPQGPQGEQGQKGDDGEQGQQGIQGIQGDKGDKGDKGESGEGYLGELKANSTVPDGKAYYFRAYAPVTTTVLKDAANASIVVTDDDLDIVNGAANYRVIIEVKEGVASRYRERVKGDKGDSKIDTWVAATYASGAQVIHDWKLYEATAATLATDVPSLSTKWKIKLFNKEIYKPLSATYTNAKYFDINNTLQNSTGWQYAEFDISAYIGKALAVKSASSGGAYSHIVDSGNVILQSFQSSASNDYLIFIVIPANATKLRLSNNYVVGVASPFVLVDEPLDNRFVKSESYASKTAAYDAKITQYDKNFEPLYKVLTNATYGNNYYFTNVGVSTAGSGWDTYTFDVATMVGKSLLVDFFANGNAYTMFKDAGGNVIAGSLIQNAGSNAVSVVVPVGAVTFAVSNNRVSNPTAGVKLVEMDDLVKPARLSNYAEVKKQNVLFPIFLKTHEGGRNQPLHPNVHYFNTAVQGHKWWMAYTPYPNSEDNKENPSLAWSDDGFNWTEVPTSPIDVPSGNILYHSDTCLVYNGSRLELWYRTVYNTSVAERVVIHRKHTTDGGITWSAREVLFKTDRGLTELISPSVIYEGGVYKMWMWSDSRLGVQYTSSADGTTSDTSWQKVNSLFDKSHFDMIKTHDGKYLYFGSYGSSAIIKVGDTEGGAFTAKETVLDLNIPEFMGGWNYNRMYKSAIVYSNNRYFLFITGGNSADMDWRMGVWMSKEENDYRNFIPMNNSYGFFQNPIFKKIQAENGLELGFGLNPARLWVNNSGQLVFTRNGVDNIVNFT